MGSSYFTQGLIGVEGTPGTAVTGKRRTQGRLLPKDDRTRKFVEQARAVFPGPNLLMDFGWLSTWTYANPVEPTEWCYWLASCFGPGTASGTEYTYEEAMAAAPDDPQTLTLYTGDDENQVRAAGCAATKFVLKFAGLKEVEGEVELIGRKPELADFSTVAFPSVASTDILTAPMTKVYINTTGAGMGTTAVLCSIYEATMTYNTGIGDDRTLSGSKDMCGFTRTSPTGTLELIAKFDAGMAGQFTAHDEIIKQFIKVETTGKDAFALSVAGAYDVMDFEVLSEERDGFNLCKASYELSDDKTWGKRLIYTANGTLAAYL